MANNKVAKEYILKSLYSTPARQPPGSSPKKYHYYQVLVYLCTDACFAFLSKCMFMYVYQYVIEIGVNIYLFPIDGILYTGAF